MLGKNTHNHNTNTYTNIVTICDCLPLSNLMQTVQVAWLWKHNNAVSCFGNNMFVYVMQPHDLLNFPLTEIPFIIPITKLPAYQSV